MFHNMNTIFALSLILLASCCVVHSEKKCKLFNIDLCKIISGDKDSAGSTNRACKSSAASAAKEAALGEGDDEDPRSCAHATEDAGHNAPHRRRCRWCLFGDRSHCTKARPPIEKSLPSLLRRIQECKKQIHDAEISAQNGNQVCTKHAPCATQPACDAPTAGSSPHVQKVVVVASSCLVQLNSTHTETPVITDVLTSTKRVYVTTLNHITLLS